jgi:hypothetical protein
MESDALGLRRSTLMGRCSKADCFVDHFELASWLIDSIAVYATANALLTV